ncbi:type I restriction enzyme S subunit [Xanthomonas campestris]|uniref:restriction endonuclease subunit S n=1 Tax=Xanthomonas euroxanthea TaxID=2259622 RepID=UPI001608B5B1|nr:restriction endonuclease subunit S [Xanthomonas euroxanthea]MBB3780490.1 type I restriction enzyme S subunit [Xanthomonas euroxanthea]
MIGWKSIQLGQVCKLQRGMDLPKRLRSDGDFPLVTSAGIDGTHSVGPVKGPGVVTGRYGTIGKVFFIEKDFWPLNTTLYVQNFHGNDPLFVNYLLKTIDFQSHSGKSGVPGVNRNDVHQELVCLPMDKAEQRLISDALADADALIDSLEQLLTKKRQIKQGAMQELLTGKRRLPGFSGDWKRFPLGELAKIKTGSLNNQDKVTDGAFPFFVRSQTVEQIDTFTHDCEAILIPGEGGIGTIFHYMHGRFALHQRVYGITEFSGKLLGRFLFYYLRVYFGAHAMENSVKATVDSLRLPTFLNFQVWMPPTIDEQLAIVQSLWDLENEAETLESRLTKVRALKQAMAQALLAGRIRLVEPAA